MSATDLHTADGGGLSGLSGDRAYDNTAAVGMGVFNAGPIARHNADNNSIDALSAFTLTGWLKPASTIHGNAAIFSNQDSVSEPDKGFTLSAGPGGALQLQVDPSGGTGVATSRASYTGTDWFFFAVSYDGTLTSNNVFFYKGTQTSGIVQIDSPLTINKGALDDESQIFALGNYTAPTSDPRFPGNGPMDALLDNMRIFGSKSDGAGVLGLGDLEFIRQADTLNHSIPEPSTLVLLCMGVVALLALRTRRGVPVVTFHRG